MKWGIVISSNDVETVWNAFRIGVFALLQGDEVKAFLTGKGVEAEQLDTAKFKISEQMQTFLEQGGQILICGSCLKLRQSEVSTTCPVSTLQDLYTLIKEADKVLCF
jgi:sulfur relay (sulfurtransferase) complex TusBCD TusD component (DsrE family)